MPRKRKRLPRIQMVATIVKHGGYNALMIRKIIINPSIINNLVTEILSDGMFEFHGEIIFLDRSKAIAKLKEARLI